MTIASGADSSRSRNRPSTRRSKSGFIIILGSPSGSRRRSFPPLFKPTQSLSSGTRPGQEKSLREVTTQSPEAILNAPRLDTFGDNRQAKIMAEIDCALDDRIVALSQVHDK